MTITINPFSLTSIEKAQAQLETFKAKLKRLKNELPKALTEYGATIAKVNFDSAVYDVLTPESGNGSMPSFVDVKAEPTTNGWRVLAQGQEVCFIEFGAGVHFNGNGESYLGKRPEGIVGIGEYGSGRGKQDKWAFSTNTWTYGTPASNAMYFTAEEMKRRIEEEARRILNDD